MQVMDIPGLIAGADLSAEQYAAVKIGAAFSVSAFAAATDDFLGVLQNKPAAAGEPANVVVLGTTKARLGGTVTAGDRLKVQADGEFVTATEITDGSAADEQVVGIALESGADQEVIKICLTGNALNHAT